MPGKIGTMFVQFGQILVICPCCGEISRVSDIRLHAKNKYLRTPMDAIEAERARIERANDRLEEQEKALREQARVLGRQRAKERLQEIDPVFSGSGLDPQDVKVIFDPVDYIVFDGMAQKDIRRVLLLASAPQDRETERVYASLEKTIKNGNIDFKTLQVADDGALRLH